MICLREPCPLSPRPAPGTKQKTQSLPGHQWEDALSSHPFDPNTGLQDPEMGSTALPHRFTPQMRHAGAPSLFPLTFGWLGRADPSFKPAVANSFKLATAALNPCEQGLSFLCCKTAFGSS